MLLRNRIARGIAAGALVLAVPSLAGCSFATDAVYTPAPGANDRDGQVDVLNAVIVSNKDGEGTFIATFSNNKDATFADGFKDATDTLTGLDGDFTATLPTEAITVPSGGRTTLSSAQNDVAGIPVDGAFGLGDFVEVTLTFANAGKVTIKVPVVCNGNHFAGQDTNPKAGTELAPECQMPTDEKAAEGEH